MSRVLIPNFVALTPPRGFAATKFEGGVGR
jgi:hypothetical protein